jgi:dihydrofolate reductase
MRISLIAAVAENRVIGNDGTIPWRIPGEQKHFKEITIGKPVIMGRKTFESIGKPLPGRQNIVISRDVNYRADGARTATDFESALWAAADVEEVMIIGGEQIYCEAMPIADRLYITEVSETPTGDAHFPEIDPTEWREVSRETRRSTKDDAVTYDVVTYERRRTPTND